MTAPARAAVFACLSLLAIARASAQSITEAGAAPGANLAMQMLAQGDTDADRQLSLAEFRALADTWINRVDPAPTARLSREEFVLRFAIFTAPPAPPGRRGSRIGSTGNAHAIFELADRNRDAIVERAELRATFAEWFGAWDADRDGRLAGPELTRGLLAVLPRTNFGSSTGRGTQERAANLPAPPPSPVLSPEESMATVQLAAGFRLELAASEPMVEEPIALSFDEDGRAYVVELRTFMRDIDGSREREPLCRISRLEDTDGDGRFDRATVFVDGLILPRAVGATAGGILYVSDYKLHFSRDTDGDGRADHHEIVDADYGRGNVEHAANGLFRAMDNWIYNGESPQRYRLVGGTLVRQATELRGQWGMTQDNFGRLLYNVNNSQLLGDFAPPNTMGRNLHHPTTAGLSLFVATDQRVFPLRMNTAINRGYSPGVLDPAGRAYVFASSCGPVVYRGDNFPAEFVGNAFVADPSLNLIKRNLVSDQNLTLSARFAYEDREFLASTDERFRPATLYNGPDGALWFVDFYRGISQYGQFMTPYLRRETLARGLEQGISRGRIYRIVSTGKKPAPFPRLSRESPAELVARLAHPNGWVRDTAQRLLVERADRTVAPDLLRLVRDRAGDLLGRIHALWTLEGLFAELPGETPPAQTNLRLRITAPTFTLTAKSLPAEVLSACMEAVADPHAKVQGAALRVADSLTAGDPKGRAALLATITRLDPATLQSETLFQAVLTTGNLPKPDALPLFARLASHAAGHFLAREGVLSGLRDWELPFLQLLLADPMWRERAAGRAALFQALAAAIGRTGTGGEFLRGLAAQLGAEDDWRHRAIRDGLASLPAAREPAAAGRTLTEAEKARSSTGTALYQQLCAGCHGLQGQGVAPLAPPLANSEWVLGSEARLIRVILHGLGGPVRVDGTDYAPPEILPEMPPLGSLEDEKIAAVLSYLRRAWGHAAEPISTARVANERAATRSRTHAWSAAELEALK